MRTSIALIGMAVSGAIVMTLVPAAQAVAPSDQARILAALRSEAPLLALTTATPPQATDVTPTNLGPAIRPRPGLTLHPGAHNDVAVVDTAYSRTVLNVLRDRQAATNFSVDINLKKGRAQIDALGGVLVLNPQGAPTGRLSAPWAHDALGKSLPTHFILKGNRVTQYVNTTGATFPVTADPQFVWGWGSLTIYLNKRETLTASIVPGVIAAMFSAYLYVSIPLAVLAGIAQWAVGTNQCIYVRARVFSFPLGYYSGSQGSGYCS